MPSPDQITAVDAVAQTITVQPPSYDISIDQINATIVADQSAVDAAQAIVDDRTASLAGLQADLDAKKAQLATDTDFLAAAQPQMETAVAQLKISNPLQAESLAL